MLVESQQTPSADATGRFVADTESHYDWSDSHRAWSDQCVIWPLQNGTQHHFVVISMQRCLNSRRAIVVKAPRSTSANCRNSQEMASAVVLQEYQLRPYNHSTDRQHVMDICVDVCESAAICNGVATTILTCVCEPHVCPQLVHVAVFIHTSRGCRYNSHN